MSKKIDRSKIWSNYDQHVNMQIQQKNVYFEKLIWLYTNVTIRKV